MSQLTQDRPWAGGPASRDGAGSVARPPTRSLARSLLVSLVVIGASGVLAIAIVDPRFLPLLAAPAALLALWAVGRFPFAAACGVLALGVMLISSSRLKVPVGPLDLRLTELLLGALLLVALVKPRRAWWGGPAGAALLIFFAVLSASAILAMLAGRAHPVDAYHYSRSLAPALMFFVIVRLFPEPMQARRLLLAAAVMAAITGVVSIFAAVPGSPVTGFLDPSGAEDGSSSPAYEQEGMGLVNRVRLPGVALAYVLFWYCALRASRALPGQRLLWIALLGGMSVGLALSFNRNMWLGLAFGSVMVFALTHSRVRRQFVAAVLALVAMATLAGLYGVQIRTDSPVYPLVARFTTIFDPKKEAQGDSLSARFEENRHAVATIERNPVIGVGPGAPYGKTAIENFGNRVFLRKYVLFMHNQYLHLLLIGGPLALLSFLAFLLAPVVQGYRRIRHDDLFIGLSVGLAMTLLSAIVMLTFVSATWSLTLGLLAGVLTVAASAAPRAAAPVVTR